MRVGCVGAGRMGRGIAVAFAGAMQPFTLIDMKPRDAASADLLRKSVLGDIGGDLRFLVEAGLLSGKDAETALASIHVTSLEEADGAIGQCDLLFEAVPETVQAKRDCFAALEPHLGPNCILASTSSTIDPATMAAFVGRPENFLNAHWLNPAYLMPLVEVAAHEGTSAFAIQMTRSVLEAIGKLPILCKGSPGYIVPRIQALAMNDAARLVEEGVASAGDIDKAVQLGFGLRFAVLGLLEFADWGGGDILFHASEFLAARVDAHRFEAPDILRRNIAAGKRGIADGEGFHGYADVDARAFRDERLKRFVDLLRHKDLLPPFGLKSSS